MKDRIIAVLILLASSLTMQAVPAERGIHTYVQPDGTTVQFQITGDEFTRNIISLDGCALMMDDAGYYCYARFDFLGRRYCSNVRAGSKGAAAASAAAASRNFHNIFANAGAARMRAEAGRMRAEAAKRTAASLAARTRGSRASIKALIIPVQFPDLKLEFSRSDFDAMLNAPGYSLNGATGSAKDYFTDQFEGKCGIEFVVSPVVTVSRGYAHYGANNSDGLDAHPEEIVEEACRALDTQIDFSSFDSDNDGKVDQVFIFVAGEDESRGASEDHIWSHQWSIEEAGIRLILDGRQISKYAMSSELVSSNGHNILAPIGTFCHEFSHCLGLNDLYDTEHDWDSTDRSDGVWQYTSLMDYGNYNNEGRTPPNYNALEMETLGIGTVGTLGEGTHTLAPLSQQKSYFKAETDTPGEYYLFECRAAEGWDRYIHGSGMLIYHIDSKNSRNDAGYSDAYSMTMTAADRWEYNCVNGNRLHQCVDIVEATPGTNDIQKIFWPASGRNSFSIDTDPAYLYWNGNGPEHIISGIKKAGTSISFSITSTLSIESIEAFQDAAIILWTMQGMDKGRISLTDPDGRTRTEEVKPYGTNMYSFIFEGLKPKTTYKVTVYDPSDNGHKISDEFTTKAYYTDGYPFIYLNSADRNADGSFKKGSRLPLRVFNAENAKEILWYFDDRVLSSDGSGYFFVEGSGTVKAVVTYGDGTRDIISKSITVR